MRHRIPLPAPVPGSSSRNSAAASTPETENDDDFSVPQSRRSQQSNLNSTSSSTSTPGNANTNTVSGPSPFTRLTQEAIRRLSATRNESFAAYSSAAQAIRAQVHAEVLNRRPANDSNENEPGPAAPATPPRLSIQSNETPTNSNSNASNLQLQLQRPTKVLPSTSTRVPDTETEETSPTVTLARDIVDRVAVLITEIKDAAPTGDLDIYACDDVHVLRANLSETRRNNKLLSIHFDMMELQRKLEQADKWKSDEIKSVQLLVREELFAEIVQVLDAEFSCSVCNEVYITPAVTKCGHTFCELCLATWTKDKINCPICRTAIFQEWAKHVEMESFINRLYLRLSPEIRLARDKLVEEREQAHEKFKREARTNLDIASRARGRVGASASAARALEQHRNYRPLLIRNVQMQLNQNAAVNALTHSSSSAANTPTYNIYTAGENARSPILPLRTGTGQSSFPAGRGFGVDDGGRESLRTRIQETGTPRLTTMSLERLRAAIGDPPSPPSRRMQDEPYITERFNNYRNMMANRAAAERELSSSAQGESNRPEISLENPASPPPEENPGASASGPSRGIVPPPLITPEDVDRYVDELLTPEGPSTTTAPTPAPPLLTLNDPDPVTDANDPAIMRFFQEEPAVPNHEENGGRCSRTNCDLTRRLYGSLCSHIGNMEGSSTTISNPVTVPPTADLYASSRPSNTADASSTVRAIHSMLATYGGDVTPRTPSSATPSSPTTTANVTSSPTSTPTVPPLHLTRVTRQSDEEGPSFADVVAGRSARGSSSGPPVADKYSRHVSAKIKELQKRSATANAIVASIDAATNYRSSPASIVSAFAAASVSGSGSSTGSGNGEPTSPSIINPASPSILRAFGPPQPPLSTITISRCKRHRKDGVRDIRSSYSPQSPPTRETEGRADVVRDFTSDLRQLRALRSPAAVATVTSENQGNTNSEAIAIDTARIGTRDSSSTAAGSSSMSQDGNSARTSREPFRKIVRRSISSSGKTSPFIIVSTSSDDDVEVIEVKRKKPKTFKGPPNSALIAMNIIPSTGGSPGASSASVVNANVNQTNTPPLTPATPETSLIDTSSDGENTIDIEIDPVSGPPSRTVASSGSGSGSSPAQTSTAGCSTSSAVGLVKRKRSGKSLTLIKRTLAIKEEMEDDNESEEEADEENEDNVDTSPSAKFRDDDEDDDEEEELRQTRANIMRISRRLI